MADQIGTICYSSYDADLALFGSIPGRPLFGRFLEIGFRCLMADQIGTICYSSYDADLHVLVRIRVVPFLAFLWRLDFDV